jgi:hypothetical protein
MQDNYKKLFQHLTKADPPERVYENIMTRIQREKYQCLRIKSVVSGVFAFFSFVGIFFSLGLLIDGFYQTGILQYFSLVFSDSGNIFVFWKEFSLLVVETLPFFEIILLLFTVFVFLGSLRIALRRIRIPSFHLNGAH